MNIFCRLFVCSAVVALCKAIVWSNISIEFDYVSNDEIVILQDALENLGHISRMPVKGPYIFQSVDIPRAPWNLTAFPHSSSEIRLLWGPVNYTDAGNLTVDGYMLFYKEYSDNIYKWNVKPLFNALTSATIERLEPDSTYVVRVLAYHAKGNGISSNYVEEKTMEGTPLVAPGNFKCYEVSNTSIQLTWDLIEEDWNGQKENYTATFRKFMSSDRFEEEKFDVAARTGKIYDLRPNTKYEIFLTGNTNGGAGPKAWCVQSTTEYVPTKGPVITYWELNPNRPSEGLFNWDPIDHDYVNGDLSGYMIYRGISRNGKLRREPPEMTSYEVGKYTSRAILKPLPTDVEVTVQVAGMTAMGVGVKSKPVYIESCRCPKLLYVAWYEDRQLVYKGKDGTMMGLFPSFVEEMIQVLCGVCKGIKRNTDSIPTTVYWDRSKDGHSNLRKDEKHLRSLLGDNVHIHLPINTRTVLETLQSKYKFVSLLTSPGIAFIVRDQFAELDKTTAIVSSLFSCWPSVVIIFLFSLISGMFIWVLDRTANENEFTKESFIRGIYHGTYWAFISMTTIGYGDKVPRSVLAKCAAMCWMLMGPIINGLLVGVVTTSLTSITIADDTIIYGSKVGAVPDTFEYNLGVRRNAQMNPPNVNCTTSKELIKNLVAKKLDGILLNSIETSAITKELADKKLKIVKIIEESYGWGIVLSSDMLKLEDDVRSYVKNRETYLNTLLKNITGHVKVQASPPNNLDTGLIDPQSPLFRNIVIFGSIAILVAIVIAFLYECVYQKLKTNKVKPFDLKAELERDLAGMVRDFCGNVTTAIENQHKGQEKELKKFFWKKGYSFGFDGRIRHMTNDEEKLKVQIRNKEIMCTDLQLTNRIGTRKWNKGKHMIGNLSLALSRNKDFAP